jgi:uncharacterized protein (TIGR02996 family)
MSDQAAFLAAIVADPDEDTPRLVYADWLDENCPDATPSPAAGASARAEYVRVQCRLARLPFDEPDYPELLEREEDLAAWLNAHTPAGEAEPDLPADLRWFGEFGCGDGGYYRRGFPDRAEYTEYTDDPDENVERILAALPAAFARSTVRTLDLTDAYGEEVVGLMRSPVVAGLRGLVLADIQDDKEDDAVRAVAACPHLAGLRRLFVDFYIDDDDLARLARAECLDGLESFCLDYPTPLGLRPLAPARWFRNLRSLELWSDSRDALKALAELPAMPNLVSLRLRGTSAVPTLAAVRKFAASDSFPRLARLDLDNARLTPEQVAVLARGAWPLRHLRLRHAAVRKPGAEALARAPFAGTLRVLELPECEITAGGVQALAAAEALGGLRHLDLGSNPVGVGGLAALARSRHLRGLRRLTLSGCNSARAPLDAAALLNFLAALEAPDLRHLKLDRLPVGVRGARVLAGGGFANLTRLSLAGCGLREGGARALVESGGLANLAVLDMPDNGAGKGVARLADPKVLPRLAGADLVRNRVPKWPLSRLRKRPGVRV